MSSLSKKDKIILAVSIVGTVISSVMEYETLKWFFMILFIFVAIAIKGRQRSELEQKLSAEERAKIYVEQTLKTRLLFTMFALFAIANPFISLALSSFTEPRTWSRHIAFFAPSLLLILIAKNKKARKMMGVGTHIEGIGLLLFLSFSFIFLLFSFGATMSGFA